MNRNSFSTMRAPARSLAMAMKATSNSRGSRTAKGWSWIAMVPAARCTSLNMKAATWLSGFHSRATLESWGTISLSKLQMLSGHFQGEGHSREVPARPRGAGNEAGRDRLGDRSHDNRDRLGGPLGRMCRRRTPRHDDIHVKADQLGREVSERFNSSVGEPRLESDVLALTVSALGQPSTELFDVG